jgi:hypothetical protein
VDPRFHGDDNEGLSGRMVENQSDKLDMSDRSDLGLVGKIEISIFGNDNTILIGETRRTKFPQELWSYFFK